MADQRDVSHVARLRLAGRMWGARGSHGARTRLIRHWRRLLLSSVRLPAQPPFTCRPPATTPWTLITGRRARRACRDRSAAGTAVGSHGHAERAATRAGPGAD